MPAEGSRCGRCGFSTSDPTGSQGARATGMHPLAPVAFVVAGLAVGLAATLLVSLALGIPLGLVGGGIGVWVLERGRRSI